MAGGTGGAAEAAPAAATSLQRVAVATYNILDNRFDGTVTSGERIAPWNSRRRVAAAKLVLRGKPDVIAVQEGSGWTTSVHGYGGTRQVDSLRAALGPSWALARTEVPPTEHGFRRTGVYVLYRKTAFTAVGAGGHWSLGQTREAAYQVLRARSTGAQLLVTSTHLYTPAGRAADNVRRTETATLIRNATAFARKRGNMPVVYAGDFNSYAGKNHPVDGPGLAMHAAHNTDTRRTARTVANAQYNSANQYRRVALKYGDLIDHIFVSPGVAARAWNQLLNVSRGRQVGVIPSDHNVVLTSLDIRYPTKR